MDDLIISEIMKTGMASKNCYFQISWQKAYNNFCLLKYNDIRNKMKDSLLISPTDNVT